MERMNSKEEFFKLITTQDFINWIKCPTPQSEDYWQEFFLNHPELENELSKAKYVIERLQKEKREVDQTQIAQLWSNIQQNIKKTEPEIRITQRWLAAASIILLIGIAGITFFLTYNNRNEIDYQKMAKTPTKDEDIQLVLADKSTELIQAQEPSISYAQKGEIIIDSTTIQQKQKPEESKKEIEFNQLIVPYGKRSNLTLSDGSIVYLNSGSQVIYPVNFDTKRREIYIKGEAYLKVSHNKNWPFWVTTDNLKVKVLGTEFNVKAYAEESNSSVVLVSGSVQAELDSKKILMKENELLALNKTTGKVDQKSIDVKEYVSWKDGWLFCNKEKMQNIAAQLSRYYNIDIQNQDPEINGMLISGKLELKPDIAQVLDAICFTAPLKYEKSEDKIIFYKND